MDQLRRIRENISPSQLFFLLIMIPMASFAPILYESCSNFYKYRELERPDYDNAKWSDFLLVLVISPFFTLAKHIANKLSRGYFHSKLKVKYQGEALELKINKSTRNFFKVFYFGFITLLGFYVYSDTNYQSGLMFGSGNLRYVSSDWPYTKIPRLLKLYYNQIQILSKLKNKQHNLHKRLIIIVAWITARPNRILNLFYLIYTNLNSLIRILITLVMNKMSSLCNFFIFWFWFCFIFVFNCIWLEWAITLKILCTTFLIQLRMTSLKCCFITTSHYYWSLGLIWQISGITESV